MNIHFCNKSESINDITRFTINMPTYSEEPLLWYDYIMVRPIGTECIIVCSPPNIFKFYHITADVVCDKIPFMTLYIPNISLGVTTIMHATISE